jgi:hypothetical protein
MTKLIILLCFSFGRVAGQTTTQTRYDTIPVVMLVGDTARTGWFESGDSLFDYSHPVIKTNVWQMRGYEVLRKGNSETEYEQANPGQVHAVLKMNGNSPWDYTEHIAYLDEKKKPLKVYVWRSVKP